MDGLLADRLDSRRKAFKKGVDAEDMRRKREDEAASIRKAKKDGMMQKKRQMVDASSVDTENAPANANAPAGTKDAKCPSMAVMAARLAAPIPPEERLLITIEIRKQLSKANNPPTQEALEAGLISPMVTFIAQQEDAKLQLEALWALTNIASGEKHQTEAVVQGGAVPHLVQLLSAPSMELRDQAVWALANIAGDSPEARNFVLQHQPVPAVLKLIVDAEQHGNVTMLQNATWALGNVCRGRPAPPMEAIAPAVPYLSALLNHPNNDVVADTIWVFSYLTDGDGQRIDLVLASGALPGIVAKLNDVDDRIVQPALRTVGNITSGSNEQTTTIVQSGALAHLKALLQHRKKAIRKEALWALSNVTAGTREQVQAVLDSGVMPDAIALARSGCWTVRKEALWLVANVMVGGAIEQVEYMFQIGAAQLLTEALDQNNDHSTTLAVLDAIAKLLCHGAVAGGVNPYAFAVEEADGLTKLEQLQDDANNDVYERAVHIITKYFGGEDEDEAADGAGPSLVTEGFNFA